MKKAHTMKHHLFIIALMLGIVLSLMLIRDNQSPSQKEKIHASVDINSPEKTDPNTNKPPTQLIVAESRSLTPQIGDIRRGSNSDQIKTDMDSYQAKLIQKAEKLINRAKSIPPGIDPTVETNGDFMVVFWPIPREGRNMVPGPSKYAAVHFRKGTFDVEGVLGAH